MIKYIQGDLFTTRAEIIAHGVNCRGGFGSGIAGIIAQKYPRVREAYLNKFNRYGWELGEIQLVFSTDILELPIIANMATQLNYGTKLGKLYANYKAVEICLYKVFKFADMGNFTVALPRVACGLAGGDWNVVKAIIGNVSNEYDRVPVEVYSL
jgi:O-acetyl-ADP-ribose deacetylase (regulator of RNase III)